MFCGWRIQLFIQDEKLSLIQEYSGSFCKSPSSFRLTWFLFGLSICAWNGFHQGVKSVFSISCPTGFDSLYTGKSINCKFNLSAHKFGEFSAAREWERWGAESWVVGIGIWSCTHKNSSSDPLHYMHIRTEHCMSLMGRDLARGPTDTMPTQKCILVKILPDNNPSHFDVKPNAITAQTQT